MESLKHRVLTGWTLTRFIYLGLGSAFIVNSFVTEQWFGVAFGAYFASMGLFAFGCASGNCYVPPSQNTVQKQDTTDVLNVKFEEIKQK